jgi:uncharacterized protein GlcG (DUF336 family)
VAQISLSQSNAIIQGAFAVGRERSLKPLCVAVVDAGGHLVACQRQDGSSTLRPQIAMGKAAGALGLGMSSRRIGEMSAERPSFIASLGSISSLGIIPAAGGVIIADDHNQPIGAVGVTGDTSDNDEICAIAGLSAAGLNIQK